MQKATQGSIEEQKNRLIDKRDREWVSLAIEPTGSLAGQKNISTFLSIGNDYVSQLVDMLLDAEQNALSSGRSALIDDNYFTKLTSEVIGLMQTEYRSILDRAFIRYELLPKDERAELTRDIERLIYHKRRTILQRIEYIKENLNGTSSGSCSASSGGAVPTFADNNMLFFSIRAKIRSSSGLENGKFLETFDRLLEEIYRSSVSNKEKFLLLQNLDFLIDQYNAPSEKINPGLINASLYYLASAANEAKIWLKFGPVIVGYFNKFI